MNFDFIKELDGLGKVYKACDNAEKLVMTIPDASMFESRKSAEAIAKGVYLVAHAEKAEDLSFKEILSDYTLKQYLHNSELINAFHSVRKEGNRAVHDAEQEESSDDAISVLENLHFIVGEVAKRMGLIRYYPKFDNNISVYPDAKPLDPNSYESLGKEMYEDFIVSKYSVEKLKADFDDLSSPYIFIPGLVDLNEFIEFKRKPKSDITLSKTQQHFAFVGLQALKALRNGNDKVKCNMELEVQGKTSYKTDDLVDVIGGILYDLPKAKSFRITSYYNGPSIAPWFNNDARFNNHSSKEYSDIVEDFDDSERFIYKTFQFLYNHGEGWCNKYSNGDWYNKDEYYDDSILDKDYGEAWWCWNINLVIDFDFDEHKEIIDALHQAVREHVPESELELCEQTWENDDPGILLDSVQWQTHKLREIQDFLDEVNALIKPIISECDLSNEANKENYWYLPKMPFGFATMKYTKEGFQIVGISY